MKTTDTPRTDAARLKLGQELERELKASKAEVARLQNELDATCNAEELRQERETRKRAEAEVARLNNILENTRMSRDTMIEDRNLLDQELAASQAEVERLKRELDAWDYGTRAKREQEARKKAEAEVERLRSQLARSVEIAETACKYLDTGGWNEDEMYSGKDGWVTETEIDEVCATLAVLKSEIK
jgi:colicin import membrane protein